MTEQEFVTLLPIPDTDFLYRQVHDQDLKQIPGVEAGRFPKERHFIPNEDGLSMHWHQYVSPEGVYHIIGLSFRGTTTTFKDPAKFKIVSIPVAVLRSIEQVSAVEHSPVFNGNPAAVGSPNNYAHSSVKFPNDEEIRLKLSDYCRDNHTNCFQQVDMQLIEREVQDLRSRLNNTLYHRF
jgi:hypothetical protein